MHQLSSHLLNIEYPLWSIMSEQLDSSICSGCTLQTTGVLESVPARLLGTRFEARICISKPRPQAPHRDIF
jgi:hypothetical protein